MQMIQRSDNVCCITFASQRVSLIVIPFCLSVCQSFRDLQPTTIDRSQPFWIPYLPYFRCQREKYAKFRLLHILATANVTHRATWLVCLSVCLQSINTIYCRHQSFAAHTCADKTSGGGTGWKKYWGEVSKHRRRKGKGEGDPLSLWGFGGNKHRNFWKCVVKILHFGAF